MSKTIHRDKYTIQSRPTQIDDDLWDMAFKRDKKNPEKSRYARKQKNAKD